MVCAANSDKYARDSDRPNDENCFNGQRAVAEARIGRRVLGWANRKGLRNCYRCPYEDKAPAGTSAAGEPRLAALLGCGAVRHAEQVVCLAVVAASHGGVALP